MSTGPPPEPRSFDLTESASEAARADPQAEQDTQGPRGPSRRERWLGAPDPRGVTRAAIALWLIGLLAAMQIWAPPPRAESAVTAATTLAITVVSFYFGQRVRAASEREAEALEAIEPRGPTEGPPV